MKRENMKLFLEKHLKQLIKNHNEQDGSKDFKVVVKLFNPCGLGTWYLSELDPTTNVAFGLSCLHEKELGYVSIDEITSLKLPLGLSIERDRLFDINKYSLEECKTL
jgi:hypothetical protein